MLGENERLIIRSVLSYYMLILVYIIYVTLLYIICWTLSYLGVGKLRMNKIALPLLILFESWSDFKSCSNSIPDRNMRTQRQKAKAALEIPPYTYAIILIIM